MIMLILGTMFVDQMLNANLNTSYVNVNQDRYGWNVKELT